MLDTNILIKAFENTSHFKDFFKFLKDANCEIVNSELSNFEFTRNDFLPEIVAFKEEFLSEINAAPLPYKDSLLKAAIEISKIYSHQGIQKGQISLVDCCIAALLQQYGKNLFLATLDHGDFPLCLFDREYIYPIDAGSNIFPVAFYRFNEDKWKIAYAKLQQVK